MTELNPFAGLIRQVSQDEQMPKREEAKKRVDLGKWPKRNTGQRMKKQQRYQMLMHEIGEMNRKARRVQSESFGEEVIRSCKRLLDKETFAMVMDDAHRSHARAVAALDEAVL